MSSNKNLNTNEISLNNDLDLVIVNNFPSTFVTFLLLVGVGSRDETNDLSGIAHCLEHMFFKGTKSFPTSSELAMKIELLGGITNAFTSYEYTGYYIKVPNHNKSEALNIFSELVQLPIFRAQELEKEKGVIKEEIRMYRDLPSEKARQAFNSKIFEGHALGRDIAGSEKSLGNISLEKLKEFHNINYNPKNSLLIVCGNFKEELIDEIEQRFSDKADTSNIKRSKYKNKSIDDRFINVIHPGEQAHIILGGVGFGINTPEEYEFRLGMNILAQGFGSKLFQSLREEHAIAYSCGGSVQSFTDTGKYYIAAGVTPTKVKDGVEAMTKGIDEMLAGEFSENDLVRAKNYYLSSLMESLEDVEDRAVWLGLNKLLKKKIKTTDELYKRILSIEKDQVVGSWRKYANRSDRLLVLLTPKSFQNRDRIEKYLD